MIGQYGSWKLPWTRWKQRGNEDTLCNAQGGGGHRFAPWEHTPALTLDTGEQHPTLVTWGFITGQDIPVIHLLPAVSGIWQGRVGVVRPGHSAAVGPRYGCCVLSRRLWCIRGVGAVESASVACTAQRERSPSGQCKSRAIEKVTNSGVWLRDKQGARTY